jgi:pSer/pThr/pTyr-binding forkhead associated (FHA) protein
MSRSADATDIERATRSSWWRRSPTLGVRVASGCGDKRSETGRRVELDLEVAIGRQDTDLVVEDPEVSRRHAVLRRSDGSVIVEDLDSTNGTFVNGERIRSPIAVGPGDQIRVGQTTLEIEPDQRADDTIVSTPPRPDQLRSTEAPSGAVPAEAHEDATQPLPFRRVESPSRPAPSNRRWLGVGAVAVVVLVGVIACDARRSAGPERLSARASLKPARPSGGGGRRGSSRPPTRRAQRARSIRLRRAAPAPRSGQPRTTPSHECFLSAFGNDASIAEVERAIGADNNHAVARAMRRLRGTSRRTELAASAGIAGCGGIGIR